jgi:hypothetical protein
MYRLGHEPRIRRNDHGVDIVLVQRFLRELREGAIVSDGRGRGTTTEGIVAHERPGFAAASRASSTWRRTRRFGDTSAGASRSRR